MYPILYHSDLLTVRSYGLMLALSFVVGMLLAHARAKKAGVDPHLSPHLFLLVLYAAVVGSRLLYVGENFSHYAADPWRVLRIWEGGLSMYGGVLLAIAVSFFYIKAMGEPFTKVADICAPFLALGEALTRMGCFFNGCCFGTICDLPWAVVFPKNSFAGHVFPDTSIHPTQLYSALYSLLIFGILLAAEKKSRPPGYIIGLFFLLHATARFLVEFVRYSEPSAITFAVGNVALTSYQLISLGLFVLGGHIFLTSKKGAAQLSAR
jgi:phosphatidylglycerol:prolipoprotein diacylglycerol transferase